MPAPDQLTAPTSRTFEKWMREPVSPSVEQAELLRELLDEVRGLRADLTRSRWLPDTPLVRRILAEIEQR